MHNSAGKTWLLVLLLCLFVLPLLGGTYWMWVQSRMEIENRELQGDLFRARTLAAMVSKDLSSAETILTSIAGRSSLRADWSHRDLSSIRDELREAQNFDPAFLFVSVYETDGTLRAIVPSDPIVGRNFAYRDWYRGVTADWKPYISEVYHTAAGSQPLVVAVAVPILDEHGNSAGILMATYSLAKLAEKFSTLEKGSWEGFVIVDQHGMLAASPEVRTEGDPMRVSYSGLVDRALGGAEGSREVSLNGQNLYVGYAPISQFGWAALYQRPESQALAPAFHLKSQHRTVSLYLLLMYLATAVFAALLMRKQTHLLQANQLLNCELEKKMAETRRAREEFDRYFMLSIDLVCITGSDGYFKRVNPAWEKVLGWTTQELLSHPCMEFVHPDDRRTTAREAEDQARGKEVIKFENRYRCRDGSYRWLKWNATPVVNGEFIYAMARDITEEKKMKEQILRAKEEAERSNKFKDQFLSTMSHELRTPLNAVLGFSDLLADEHYGPLNNRQRRYISHIRSGGKHLLKLINDILDLSKIEAGRLQLAVEAIRLRPVLSETLEALGPLADQKSQTLVLQIAGSLCVRADATRLKQILTNLLGNAIKFTPDGGKIEVTAAQAGDLVRVAVRDSGPGIPAEDQRRIFEAFYRMRQGDKQVEGTGLGLAITQRLVELHGGHLGLDSQVGVGSCFHFTLPVVPTLDAAAHELAEGLPSSRRTPRILVIDDDESAAHLLESQLASVGYGVVVCADPARAIEVADEVRPDAVTLDIVMKPMSGWEVLTQLKSDPRTSHLPVIVVTIVDQPSTGVLLGADEYIVKPVQKSALLAAVERCLKSRTRNSVRPILVVEDDAPTREFIGELLSKRGYAVGTAADGAEARARVASAVPELVILDLILPSVSGLQLLSEWRHDSRTTDLPVVILTNKDLTREEKNYLETNASALLFKQDGWKEALFKQLQRILPLEVVAKS